ncbi:hypothetical protein [Pseudoruegeria sp. SHC-113]|uniref:hypothetical protein n=1 Tax=Pseudoruegeria sp. SHC-113 TaxID=2855439 RepID=UPI0021BAEBA3|nr:hypothetical protein [Pseudoruegeria sp. SHC-113]MCT8159643.1 hypothetical protein [Pseudoruegeria sp. SHC-113]
MPVSIKRIFLHLAASGLALTAASIATHAEEGMKAYEIKDMRGMRFCEFLLISADNVVIYNTSASDGCPADKWEALDLEALAAEHGVLKAQLNGPKFWAMDEQTVYLGEEKIFGGIAARYGATLPLAALGSGEGAAPYEPYVSAKNQSFVFRAGAPIYELVDAEGNVYALNAWGPNVTDGNPDNLAAQLAPAEGWTARATLPEADVIIAGTSDTPVDMVGDDMKQYYTRYRADQ